MTPLKAIRAFCRDNCCLGQPVEVRLCPSSEDSGEAAALWCRLHPYRLGKRLPPGEHFPLNAIRWRCLDCSGYSQGGVKHCWNTGCELYPYRMGKNPSRTGKGGPGVPLTSETSRRTSPAAPNSPEE